MEHEQSALIVRSVLSLARRLRAQQPPGSVSLAGIGILGTLWRLGPMPAVRLAAEEGLQPQSLSRLIVALERSGLIERRPSETDGREIVISISERGTRALHYDLRARSRWLDEAVSATLSDAERNRLFEAAESMIALAGYEADRTADEPDGAQEKNGSAQKSNRTVTN